MNVVERAQQAVTIRLPTALTVAQVALIVLMATAVFTRFWRLGTPGGFYFDEVYDAFTAREVLNGNGEAWDFTTAAPKGYAYEWVEPAMHEEFMAFGMAIFGKENAFGWRFFGALFGVGTIFFVYLIGKRLFKSELVALAAAFLMTFEGLNFAQSRLATNDIYLLFFITGALYFLVADRYIWSGIFLGMAFATKWSGALAVFPFAVYFAYKFLETRKGRKLKVPGREAAIRYALIGLALIGVSAALWVLTYATDGPGPVYILYGAAMAAGVFSIGLGAYQLWRQQDVRITERTRFLLNMASTLPIYFVVVPVGIYFLHYLPYFLTGHGFNDWWELHKQMWFYQTQTAGTQTHPYQSPWWSWLIMGRPVFLYLSPGGDKIYNLGNPIIFWLGLPAMGVIILQLLGRLRMKVDEKSAGMTLSGMLRPVDFALLFVLVAYLAFWLPWVRAPRILFLYHYMPSVPWLCLGLAYCVGRLWDGGWDWGRVTGPLASVRRLFRFNQWPVRIVIGEKEYGGFALHPRVFAVAFLAMAFVTFVYFYPHLAAFPAPNWLKESYFWFDFDCSSAASSKPLCWR